MLLGLWEGGDISAQGAVPAALPGGMSILAGGSNGGVAGDN
jgi:hypothetical protein